MSDKMKHRKIEILAPAGSYESFQAAIKSGADAVYAGGNLFGARAFADNFGTEEMLEAIDEAHLFGKKLYMTVNTLLKEKELERQLYDYLLPFYEEGLDAVIVQDLGVLSFVRKEFPDLAVHASTQMTVTGELGAEFLKKYGVERIVPARELSLNEIRKMKEASGLEIECFVHGALCYSYSGQCLFSSMLGGRSGNRGQCAQPCRLKYQVEGQRRASCVLSLKDIMTLDDIPQLVEAGIDSFKIEGRMKKPEYVAAVTEMYRKYTDLYLKRGEKAYKVREEDKRRLMDLYNRGGSCSGYYHMHNGREMLSLDRPNHAGIEAACLEKQKGRSALLKALIPLKKGDVLEISEKENITLGQDVQKGGQFSVLLAKGTRVKPHTVIFRTRNETLISEIADYLKHAELKREISVKGILKKEVPITFTFDDGVHQVTVKGEKAEAAQKQPTDRIRIEKQIQKTGNTPFRVKETELDMEEDLFIPMQVINELRRQGTEDLKEQILKSYRRKALADVTEQKSERTDGAEENITLSVLVETREQLQAAMKCGGIDRIYIDGHLDGGKLEFSDIFRSKGEKCPQLYLAMPHIFREQTKKRYDQAAETLFALPWDGILVRNLESLEYLKRHNWQKPIQADHHLYVMNKEAEKFLKKAGVTETTVSLELTGQELRDMDCKEEEMVVYGYVPMMISAGCIRKTMGNCDGKCRITEMKDRYQKIFYVKNYCDTCYNIIYNTAPLVLLDQKKEMRQTGVRKFRMYFTIESGEETKRVLELYRDVFKRGKASGDVQALFPEFTRGHLKRGIK